MTNGWTFGKKLGVGCACAVIVLLMVGVAGYRSTLHLVKTSELVEHSHRVKGLLHSFESLLKDAETGQRGFLLTGNDPYLAPYRDAMAGIDDTFGELRAATTDNPLQQRRLAELRTAMDAKREELERTITLRRERGFDAALELVKTDQGKVLMDRIRHLLAELDTEETRLLESRNDEATQSAVAARSVIAWGGTAGALLLAAVGALFARALTRQIGSSVSQIQASSTELQAAATQQASGAREQTTAMTEIATTISELLATSKQISESALHVTRIADESNRASRQGEQTVRGGKEAMLGIRRQVDLIVEHMLDLGKKSQQIGAVLDIVSELSEQTNILAINATIEAAGAGETGRRFGVVADEIRKLADRVSGSTKEIRALIDDVRSSVNTTVMTTETASKTVEAGSLQFGQIADAFSQISGQVSITMDAAREIELSTKQQSTAVEQVNVAIASVSQAATESEIATGQTLRTASELARLSHELNLLVRSNTGASPTQRHGD